MEHVEVVDYLLCIKRMWIGGMDVELGTLPQKPGAMQVIKRHAMIKSKQGTTGEM